jgi:hypothetical protein
MRLLSETFWLLVLGVIALFAFFVALGALQVTQAVGLTVAMVILAALWVAHALWASRQADGRNRAQIRDRERRGF